MICPYDKGDASLCKQLYVFVLKKQCEVIMQHREREDGVNNAINKVTIAGAAGHWQN